MKRIGVLTSGGDAPGMNAAIRAAVRCAISRDMKVFGIEHGYTGLIEGEVHEMDARSVGDILQRGGTILKSARSGRFRTEEGQEQAINILNTFGIEGLVCIGGDGTFRGALELQRRGISVMGVPGTIDNDLGYTDYTIGFDTACSTVLDAISKIRDTSSAHERITIVEVMGRSCGDIALYCGLTGGCDAILVPEKEYDLNGICRRILENVNAGKAHSVILKAEGVDISSDELTAEITKRTGREAKMVILAYLQRGGSPTMRDRLLATQCAAKAVNLLWKGESGKAIGTQNGQIVAVDLAEALQMENRWDDGMYQLITELAK